ncbi:carbohydrate binding domain-containing protein [Spirosoma gilvum]
MNNLHLLILVACSLIHSVAFGQNLIQNGSFEELDQAGNPQHWNYRPNRTIIDYTQHHGAGEKAWKILADESGSNVFQLLTSTLQPDIEYTLSAWVKTQALQGGTHKIALQFRQQNFDVWTPTRLEGTNDWTRISVNFTPLSTAAGSIYLHFDFLQGTAWVDEVNLEETRDRTPSKIISKAKPFRLQPAQLSTVSATLVDPMNSVVTSATGSVTFTNLDPTIVSITGSSVGELHGGIAQIKLTAGQSNGLARIRVIYEDRLVDTIRLLNAPDYQHNRIFPLGVYMFAREDSRTYYKKLVNDLADLGINMAFLRNPDFGDQFFDALEQAGSNIKVIAETTLGFRPDLFKCGYTEKNGYFNDWQAGIAFAGSYSNIGRFKNRANLYGYMLQDEPSLEHEMNTIGMHRNLLYSIDPMRDGFTIDASDTLYIDRDRRITNPSINFFHRYTFHHNTPIGTVADYPGFEGQLLSHEKGLSFLRNKYPDKPFWLLVQSLKTTAPDTQLEDLRYPTAAEMKYQAYIALSYNAKGLFYFVYQDFPQHPEKFEAIIEAGPTIQHKPLWAPISEINQKINKTANIFLNAVWKETTQALTTSDRMVRIAEFNLDGNTYFFVVNRKLQNNTQASLTFDRNVQSVTDLFDSNQLIPKATRDGQYSINLKPGDAMLLKVDYQSPTEMLTLEKRSSGRITSFPNPFKSTTQIEYELPKSGMVNLSIIDVTGKIIKKLIENEFKQAGTHSFYFDGSNYPKGVYFSLIEGPGFTGSTKMILDTYQEN